MPKRKKDKTCRAEEALFELVALRLAPVVAVDGGQIEVASFDPKSGEVAVRFKGTYLGSPCRKVILNLVVEPIVKGCLPEVKSVVMVD